MPKQQLADKRDRFAPMPQFAFDALRDKPASWMLTYQLFRQYADHKTDVIATSYGGILDHLARKRIYLTKSGARYIVEGLQALGLVERDRQANREGRRLRLILRRSVTTTAKQLLIALGVFLTGIGLHPSLQREKAAETGMNAAHRYQKIPSGSISKTESGKPEAETRTPEGQATGRQALAALRDLIRTGKA